MCSLPEENCVLQGKLEGCEAAPLLVFSKTCLTLEGLYILTGYTGKHKLFGLW